MSHLSRLVVAMVVALVLSPLADPVAASDVTVFLVFGRWPIAGVMAGSVTAMHGVSEHRALADDAQRLQDESDGRHAVPAVWSLVTERPDVRTAAPGASQSSRIVPLVLRI